MRRRSGGAEWRRSVSPTRLLKAGLRTIYGLDHVWYKTKMAHISNPGTNSQKRPRSEIVVDTDDPVPLSKSSFYSRVLWLKDHINERGLFRVLHTLMTRNTFCELYRILDRLLAGRDFSRAFSKIRKSIINLDSATNVSDLCFEWADDHVFSLIFLWSSYWNSDDPYHNVEFMGSDADVLRSTRGKLESKLDSSLLLPGLGQKIRDLLEEAQAAKMSAK